LNAPGTAPIRLLLVDSQPAVRRGLKMRFALEPDLEVVGEAGDAAEAITLARALGPDVVLIDVEIPGNGGIAAIESLRTAAPHCAVVIFTLRDDAATRERARGAGAAAFVAKHRTEEMLLAAIRGATRGRQGDHDRASASTQEEHTDDLCERQDQEGNDDLVARAAVDRCNTCRVSVRPGAYGEIEDATLGQAVRGGCA